MASKTAVLSVRIISDGKEAKKGFNETERAAADFEQSLDKTAVASAAALAAITAIGAGATSAASDLEQSAGAVEAVFGAQADAVKQLAAQAADQVGLAKQDYQQMSAQLGAQLKNLGADQDGLADTTANLIGLSADLAARWNTDTTDAVQALSSLFRGERDPIERYGVTIKQMDVDSKVAAMGLDGLTGSAKTQAEMQATLALLYEQTGDAQGAFAEETDSAAGSAQIAAANWKTAAAELGQSLLPIVSQGANLLADMARGFIANSDVLGPLVITLGGFVATVAGLVVAVRAYRAIAELAAAAQVVWNVAMSANPIGLIIIAIAALIGFIVLIGTNWEDVQKIWGDAIGTMIGWVEGLINWLIDAINWISKFFGAAGDIGHVDWGVGAPNEARTAVADDGPMMFARAFAAPAPAPAQFAGARYARGSSSQPATPINITVNGALDPSAVARQIQSVLNKYGKDTGTVAAGGARWNPSTAR